MKALSTSWCDEYYTQVYENANDQPNAIWPAGCCLSLSGLSAESEKNNISASLASGAKRAVKL
jgi:hypothetical protein